MPIYEYSCKKCGEVIERIQRFSDPPLRKHAGCGGSLTKLISQSAFQLKGSGWYVTDYARSGAAPPADAGEAAGSSETKDSDKADRTDKSDQKDSVPTDKKAKKDTPSGKTGLDE